MVSNLTLSQDARLHKYVRLPSGWKYLRADYSENFGVKPHSVFLPKTNTPTVNRVHRKRYRMSTHVHRGGAPLITVTVLELVLATYTMPVTALTASASGSLPTFTVLLTPVAPSIAVTVPLPALAT